MRERLARLTGRLWQFFRTLFSPLWRFLGRLGLALRKLLTWFMYYPLFFLTMPLWLPLRWLWDYVRPVLASGWRFLGRMGLAIRYLLTAFVWRPFILLLVEPAVWLVRDVLRPFLLWLFRQTRRFLGWLWRLAAIPAVWFWRVTEPTRRKYGRRFNSRWQVTKARWRVRLKRPSPPTGAEFVRRQPRSRVHSNRTVRVAMAVATIALILAVGVISMQERQGTAVAESVTIILTPTPRPETPTPVPTIAIQLTPWATPDPTTGGGAILYSQHVNGNSDIYMLPIGQADPVRITTDPAPDRDPVWSPDGSQIAFASRRGGNWDIYVYDIAAGKLRRLTRDKGYDGDPTWSPDGQWLAFSSYRQDNLDIYLVPADGSSSPFRLTRDPAPDFNPVWSPTGGRHIAFTSWRSGNQDIFLRSLDDATGEQVLNVTESPDAHEADAAFSPDGRYLSYVADDGTIPVIYARPLNEDYSLAGEPVGLNLQGRDPVWSPDSQSFVAVYDRGGQSFLVAGSKDAWGVTPQMLAADGRIESPSWTAVNLTPVMAESLRFIDGEPDDQPLFVEALARPSRNQPPVKLFEMDVNAPSPYLADAVDQSFAALRQRVIEEAGWDFLGQLDAMFEPLEAKPPPGQSPETWHKAGRAFNLYYREALGFEPRVEVVREDVGSETYWRVYVRAAKQDGSQGEPLRALPWDFQARSGDDPLYYEQGGKLKDAIPAGYYVDFTALAADYGWERVPANPRWRTFFPDIRFWQYENWQGATWEEAMAQLYTSVEMRRVFGGQ